MFHFDLTFYGYNLDNLKFGEIKRYNKTKWDWIHLKIEVRIISIWYNVIKMIIFIRIDLSLIRINESVSRNPFSWDFVKSSKHLFNTCLNHPSTILGWKTKLKKLSFAFFPYRDREYRTILIFDTNKSIWVILDFPISNSRLK